MALNKGKSHEGNLFQSFRDLRLGRSLKGRGECEKLCMHNFSVFFGLISRLCHKFFFCIFKLVGKLCKSNDTNPPKSILIPGCKATQ